jgi:hypothetical protein
MNGRFLINRRDAKVMGVAAGLADFTGVDPLLSASALSGSRWSPGRWWSCCTSWSVGSHLSNKRGSFAAEVGQP